MTTHYVPSASEWLLTIGVVGLGLLLFGLGEWLMPKEMEMDTAGGDGDLGAFRGLESKEVGHVRA